MSSHDHNKVLGTMHLVFGCINGLALSASHGLFWGVGGGNGFGLFGRADTPPAVRSWEEIAVRLIFFLLLCFPFLIAGYGMLKRRSWAHAAGVIASIVASLSPPLGTALCVYSLWFLFGEGKSFYADRPEVEWSGVARGAATDARPFESGSGGPGDDGGEAGYAPPAEPPNWRE